MVLVTRKDLTEATQAVQSTHVLAEYSERYTESYFDWQINHKYLVILSVPTQRELDDLVHTAKKAGVKYAVFREPDLNNELTAIALEPGDNESMTKKITSSIPLAFKDSTKRDKIVFHYNKAHNTDKTIPAWVVKHKGKSYYVKSIHSTRGFDSKETPDNPHTKGSLVFRGKLEIKDKRAYVT